MAAFPFLPALEADPDLCSHYAPSLAGTDSTYPHPTGDSPPPRSEPGSAGRLSTTSSTGSAAHSRSRLRTAGSVTSEGQGGTRRGMPSLSLLLDLLSEEEGESSPPSQGPTRLGAGLVLDPTLQAGEGPYAGDQLDEVGGFLPSGAVPSSSTPRKGQANSNSFYVALPPSPNLAPTFALRHTHTHTHTHDCTHSTARSASLPADSFRLNPIPPRSAASTPSTAYVPPSRREGSAASPDSRATAPGSGVSEAWTGQISGAGDASVRSETGVGAVAEEVMAEFAAIVSTPRPISRTQYKKPSHSHIHAPLATAPPPPPTATPSPPPSHLTRHSPTPAHPLPRPPSPPFPPSRMTTNIPIIQPYVPLRAASPPLALPLAQSSHGCPAHAGDAPDSALAAELRTAQAHVGRLQAELVEIKGLVLSLREMEQGEGAVVSAGQGGSTNGPRAAGGAREGLNEGLDRHPAVWEIAKHLHSVLPPPGQEALRTPHSAALESLSLALAFARSVDALAHHLPPSQLRREEDVFERGSLEGVLRRVQGWEAVARGRDPGRSSQAEL